MRVAKFILESALPYKKYVGLMLLAMVFVGVDKNVKPYLIKMIIDAVSIQDLQSPWILFYVYVAMQIGLLGAWFLHDTCAACMVPQIKRQITQTLLKQFGNYPWSFFQQHLSGSLSSKVSDVAKRTPIMLQTLILEVFQLGIMFMGSLIVLAQVHYGFAIAMSVWVSFFILFAYVQLRRASVLSSIEAEADATVWGNFVDCLSNMFSVKIFTAFKNEQQRLTQYLDAGVETSKRTQLFLRRYFSVQGMVCSLYMFGCLAGMLYLSQEHKISPGDFVLVFMLNFAMIDWLFQVTFILKDFIVNWGTVDQALSIFDKAPIIQDKKNAKLLQVIKGQIVFDKVHFNYQGTETLFENKSIVIEPGQKVGLVGYSGGGKSTFVSLILRLHDVSAGRILIDGQDVREVTQDSLRQQIGFIPQDPSLFHRSLMENIRYGRLDASDSEVIAAAQQAHAHEFISALPDGYASLVGERGVKLSGGQRQRIAIARAILKNAPILILDEATSQLDSLTERDIQDSLWQLMQQKTTLVVAHRLSTLLHMDSILVFDQGKIVESGSHAVLLARQGLYKTLWDAQVGGFLPDQG